MISNAKGPLFLTRFATKTYYQKFIYQEFLSVTGLKMFLFRYGLFLIWKKKRIKLYRMVFFSHENGLCRKDDAIIINSCIQTECIVSPWYFAFHMYDVVFLRKQLTPNLGQAA